MLIVGVFLQLLVVRARKIRCYEYVRGSGDVDFLTIFQSDHHTCCRQCSLIVTSLSTKNAIYPFPNPSRIPSLYSTLTLHLLHPILPLFHYPKPLHFHTSTTVFDSLYRPKALNPLHAVTHSLTLSHSDTILAAVNSPSLPRCHKSLRFPANTTLSDSLSITSF